MSWSSRRRESLGAAGSSTQRLESGSLPTRASSDLDLSSPSGPSTSRTTASSRLRSFLDLDRRSQTSEHRFYSSLLDPDLSLGDGGATRKKLRKSSDPQTPPKPTPKPAKITPVPTRAKTMVDPIFEYQFRLILIGDSTVGKSSLLRYFTDGTFAEISDPTVGVDFFARLMQVHDGTNIKLQLWDTAGQERFRSITKSYYRNSVGALLVYDICNRDSFLSIPSWLMEAKRHIEPHRAVFMLVGTKLDIVASDARNREVTADEARHFADSQQICFVETSAKTGEGVEDAFSVVAQQIYDRIRTGVYKLDDGWDGIKKGYFANGRTVNSVANGRQRARAGLSVEGMAVGEPAEKKCC